MPTSRYGEEMSKDKVRAAKNTLGTEKLDGRHVEAICKRGGMKFHGKIIFRKGKYYLKTKIISQVREKMKEEGFIPQPKLTGPCIWNRIENRPPKNSVATDGKHHSRHKPSFEVIEGGLAAV